MKTQTFDLEEKRLRREIINRRAKRVLIQLPEGLKAEGARLASIAEKAGALAIVSADPCYGACDLALPEAESLGADLIVHYGHSQAVEQERVPTIYIEAKARVSVKDAVKRALSLLKPWQHIGLATTVQHVDALEEAKELLLEARKTVAIGDAGRVKHAGQVVGCNYSNAKAVSEGVEAFLFIGGGRFHALGVALATGKPTVVTDPYEKKAYPIHDEVSKIIRQRWACINEAKGTSKFGVLISLKSGQKKIPEALEIKEKLEKSGKKATLLALREIVPEALMQFPNLETFVNTACLRISLDDTSRFPRPLLTPSETLVMLDEMDWEALCRRGWFEG